MKCRLVFIVASMFLLSSQTIFAQQGSADSSADIAFWVDHWSRPKLALFGPEEEAFNNNVHQITFSWDDSNDATDPGVLDANVRWLKDHPTSRGTRRQEANWCSISRFPSGERIGSNKLW